MIKSFLGSKGVAAILISLMLMAGTATAGDRKHKGKHGKRRPMVHRHMKHMKHMKPMKHMKM